MIRPEGIYRCRGCGATFAEYINGCTHCWDDELSIEANRERYPDRKVVLVIPDPPDYSTPVNTDSPVTP